MILFAAVALRLLGGMTYIRAVFTDKAKPHVITWFFWGLTALIAFVIQLTEHAGPIAFISLALAIGPITVFCVAIARGLHRVKFSLADKICFVLTLIGIALWVSTSNPFVALWMSVVVDFVSSVPTLIKCYFKPHTEHVLPYTISILSMVIALAGTRHWSLATALFPGYIFCINCLIVSILALRPRGLFRRWYQSMRQWQRGSEPVEM